MRQHVHVYKYKAYTHTHTLTHAQANMRVDAEHLLDENILFNSPF